jgi:quercetin 2,3-dioxygenase
MKFPPENLAAEDIPMTSEAAIHVATRFAPERADPIERTLARVVRLPPPAPGFIGEGHTAVEVLAPTDLTGSDPFVLLMDDRLDIPQRRQIGGAHPHAGLETVTLVLEGEVHDRDEGTLGAGDVLWMNAGRGVIHNEEVEAVGRSRILQLWVRLPAAARSSAPSFQLLRADAVPVRLERGAEVRLYSGSSGDLQSPIRNHAPITMADVHLRPGASIAQDLPASYNGFLYVLDGVVRVGPEGREVAAGQVGWLDWPTGSGGSGGSGAGSGESDAGSGESEAGSGDSGAGSGTGSRASVLRVRAPEGPARFVLYTGEPQREPLVHHGPFVAGSPPDIVRLFQEFRGGRFEPLSQVARRQRARP